MSLDAARVGAESMVDELDAEEQALFSDDGSTPAPAPAPVTDTPAVPATPATDATATAADADEPGDDVVEVENMGRFVRHAAMHEERSRRKELQKEKVEWQRERQQYADTQARLDERLRLLNEALGSAPIDQPQPGLPGQPQSNKVPAPEEDPFAFMRHLATRIDQIGETSQAAQQRFQEQDTYAGVKQAFTQDAGNYSQRQPDFMDAYKHLMGSRDRELQAIGYQNQQERMQVIANEELMIVAQALQAGKSPAELLYSLAAERGYRRPQAAQPSTPVAHSQPAQTAVQRVRAVQHATGTNRSLGAAGGGSAPVLSAESLANMSEAEFDKIYTSMSKADRRALFGG